MELNKSGMLTGKESLLVGRRSHEPKHKESKNDDKRQSLDKARKEISKMANRLDVPETTADLANNLVKTVYDGMKVNKFSWDAIAVSCLYIGCRKESVPRTLKEVNSASRLGLGKSRVRRCYNSLLRSLKIPLDPVTPGSFIHRFSTELLLPWLVENAAVVISITAVDLNIVPGRSPISVAAASIYMASQASADKRSKAMISNTTGIFPVTISLSYKLMLTRAPELFPSGFNFVTPIEQLPAF